MNPAATEHQEIERPFLVDAIPSHLERCEQLAIDQGYIAKNRQSPCGGKIAAVFF